MLSFRSEFYNITNHPNFNQPNFGGNGVVASEVPGESCTSPTFGAIGLARGAPGRSNSQRSFTTKRNVNRNSRIRGSRFVHNQLTRDKDSAPAR